MVAPADHARANAAYNGFLALGMLLGPPVSSAIFEAFEGAFFGVALRVCA